MWNIKVVIANPERSLLYFISRARYKNISQVPNMQLSYASCSTEFNPLRTLVAGQRSNWISRRSIEQEVLSGGFRWNQLQLMAALFKWSSHASNCWVIPHLNRPLLYENVDGTRGNPPHVFVGWNKEIIAMEFERGERWGKETGQSPLKLEGNVKNYVIMNN